MAVFEDCLDLLMPVRRPNRMSQTVEDIHGMRNIHAIADLNRSRRPDPSPLAHEAPLAERDLTAVRKDEQFALHVRVTANDDLAAGTTIVSDPGRSAQRRSFSQLASRSPYHPLCDKIRIDAPKRTEDLT